MSQLDRLSSLVSRFEIRTRDVLELNRANLSIGLIDSVPNSLWLSFTDGALATIPASNAVHLQIDFGGRANPVLEALPDTILIALDEEADLVPVATLIASEIRNRRCGGQYALDRLCEFLLVSVLRKQIETSGSQTGILAALADPNLSPVLVAIHDHPGKNWRLDDLVALSGQSRSQFMAAFHSVIGKSPMAYLKQWRMTLARNELLNGGRVKETARRYGYGSGDAFTRAFTATYGVAPTRVGESA